MNAVKNTISKEYTDKLNRVSEILKAIAHPIRLNVLEELKIHKALSVSELMEKPAFSSPCSPTT